MLLICMEESFGDKSCIHFKIEVLARRIEERGKIDLTASPLLERSNHQMPQCSKMPSHHAMNHGRIHQLHHLSGPHRGFSQVTYESESDSDKRDWGGGILQQSPLPAATVHNNPSPTLSLMIKREVLPAALQKFLRQYQEKTLWP